MAHGRQDAERGAAEGSIHLGRQLLERIFLGAEGAGEIAVQPVPGRRWHDRVRAAPCGAH